MCRKAAVLFYVHYHVCLGVYVCMFVPLKIGHIFHTPSPPIPKNCPRDVSRKKVGIPAPSRHNKYGTRKAPRFYKNYISEAWVNKFINNN